MNECTTNGTSHFTGCASLAALGLKLQEMDLFGPIRQQVHIAQKTVKYSPLDKLYDAFIALLTGAHRMVEINTRVRPDTGVQRAFGRSSCAEQSVVQQPLDACTSETVQQLACALRQIYQQHSQGYRHDYAHEWQLLDVDLTGLPCGKKAACATKGYFSHQRNRRGRQMGRVLANHYDEVVTDQLFAGNEPLSTALRPLLQAAAQILDLDELRRRRTIVRLDSGGGSLKDLNWVLEQGYQIVGKDCSGQRAHKLAQASRTGMLIPTCPSASLAGCKPQPATMCVPSSALPCAVVNVRASGKRQFSLSR